MATSGPDLLVAAYRALADDEQDEGFDRLHQLRLEEAGTESDMVRYIRSLQRVAREVGHVPTADEYREVQPKQQTPPTIPASLRRTDLRRLLLLRLARRLVGVRNYADGDNVDRVEVKLAESLLVYSRLLRQSDPPGPRCISSEKIQDFARRLRNLKAHTIN